MRDKIAKLIASSGYCAQNGYSIKVVATATGCIVKAGQHTAGIYAALARNAKLMSDNGMPVFTVAVAGDTITISQV